MTKIKFRSKEGGGDFTLVPKGTYQVQIANVDPDITSQKDNEPQIKVVFEIAGGTEYDGQKIPQWFTLNEKFGWKLEQLLEATGIEYSTEGEDVVDGKKVRELSFDPDDLLQQWVQIELGHWTSKTDGKTYHQINKYEVSPLAAEPDGEVPDESGEPAEPQAETPSPQNAAPQTPTGVARRPRPRT